MSWLVSTHQGRVRYLRLLVHEVGAIDSDVETLPNKALQPSLPVYENAITIHI